MGHANNMPIPHSLSCDTQYFFKCVCRCFTILVLLKCIACRVIQHLPLAVSFPALLITTHQSIYGNEIKNNPHILPSQPSVQ